MASILDRYRYVGPLVSATTDVIVTVESTTTGRRCALKLMTGRGAQSELAALLLACLLAPHGVVRVFEHTEYRAVEVWHFLLLEDEQCLNRRKSPITLAVMELASGDVASLDAGMFCSRGFLGSLIMQVLSTVETLAARGGLWHGDLHLRNVLWKLADPTTERMRFLLADFGRADCGATPQEAHRHAALDVVRFLWDVQTKARAAGFADWNLVLSEELHTRLLQGELRPADVLKLHPLL